MIETLFPEMESRWYWEQAVSDIDNVRHDPVTLPLAWRQPTYSTVALVTSELQVKLRPDRSSLRYYLSGCPDSLLSRQSAFH
jgi:hypothetical protein